MNWRRVPLKRLFRIANGGTPTSDELNWNGGVPWATPADLRNVGPTIDHTARTLTKTGVASGSRLVPAGSIIISTRAPVGYVSIASIKLAFNQGCKALVPTTELDVRYFYYQLMSRTDELNSRALGTTFLELGSDSLSSMEVYAPPIQEQRRIGDFLDAELPEIDRLVSSRMRQRQLLADRVAQLISETLLPADADGSSHPQFPWLPGLQGDRPLVRLGYIATLQNGLTVDSSRASGSCVLPYLRVANVQAGKLDLTNLTEISVSKSVAKRSTLRAGDVLMTEGGDLDKLGRGAVWHGEIPDCLHQNHVFAIRPDTTRLDPEYLALMTQTQHGRCYFESTGVKTTNLASTNSSKILSFRIPLPPVGEQRHLTRKILTEMEQVNRIDRSISANIKLLDERRQALVTNMVSGTDQ